MGLLLTDTAKPNANGSTKKGGGGEKSDGILGDVGEVKADTREDWKIGLIIKKNLWRISGKVLWQSVLANLIVS